MDINDNYFTKKLKPKIKLVNKKPYQKSLAELLTEMKSKPKPEKKQYYSGETPPWD